MSPMRPEWRPSWNGQISSRCSSYRATLSIVGVAAMIWVSGHIVPASSDHVGPHAQHSWVHCAESAIHRVTGVLGPSLGWLANMVGSAALGFSMDALTVAVGHALPRSPGRDASAW